MFKSSHLFTSLAAVLLALALFPFSALALTENSLESAPEVSLPEDDTSDIIVETPDDVQEEFNYSPNPHTLATRGTVQESEELNLPRLTNAELAMVQELMAAREAGEQIDFHDRHYALSEKVFEAGVYPLDPESFNGRTFYVILPYFQMDKEQLLSLISAFEELGIPFDPDSLNSTNCIRGTALLFNAATRELSYEEQARMEKIKKMVRRGSFDMDAFTADPSCMSVQVQLPGYGGLTYEYLEPFCFYPYRPMTDNELATFAFAQETEWEIHPDRLEKTARQYAQELFRLPLSMTAIMESRYAYSEDYIEFRNSFRIDPENCDGLYASADEIPFEVMVEQMISDKQGEASVARILIDYPAMYDSRPTDGQSGCSGEELKAAAEQWAGKYLLVPEEDILTGWVFDSRQEAWESVEYRMLTTEWLVCLEMSENTADYYQASIYNRKHAVEFDDWDQEIPEETGAGDTDEKEEPAESFDPEHLDENARQCVYSLLNLPPDMTTISASRDDAWYVQYRNDYSFDTGENSGKNSSPDRSPQSMIVYQIPYFTQTTDLRVETIFLSYPHQSDNQVQLTDEQFKAAAQEWAEKTLLIPREEILEDWSFEARDTQWSVTYRLTTSEWTIYLQMDMSGECCWCGLYRQ